MSLKIVVKDFLNTVLKSYGHEIIKSELLYDWQKTTNSEPSYNENSLLPVGAKDYLHKNHPTLLDLQKRYADFNSTVTEPLVWNSDHVREEDILYFRGDNAYVWQLRGPNMNALSYALSTFYVKAIDEFQLLNKLGEDKYFGNYAFTIAEKLIARDLLDSIMEIYFLEKHLKLFSSKRKLNFLDVGAGYGRLAYRVLSAFQSVEHYFCTDAVATSTFISDYYLNFRKLEGRAQVIPLDEIEEVLKNQDIDVAVNMHSFSECKISAVDWWVSLLAKNRIGYLMVVPNSGDHGGERLLTNDGKDMQVIVEKHGYHLVAKDPKYRDPLVQKHGINPTYHYLFKLG